MAEYATQGTVQIEIEAGNLVVNINPTMDYRLRYQGDDYIIFMPKNIKGAAPATKKAPAITLASLFLDAKALKASEAKKFKLPTPTPTPTDLMAQVIMQAAFQKTAIQLIVDGSNLDVITSVTIPSSP